MKKLKSIILYLVIFILILWIGYSSERLIIDNEILMNKLSYYGTIITGFSLVITFLEIWKTKTIQQEIKDSIKEKSTQKSLQYNPIIQKHLVSLKGFLYNDNFEMAKLEVDIVKNLILHHSKYEDIINVIKSNTSSIKGKGSFFEALENQLIKVTISAPEDIVLRNIIEFREYKDYSIKILTQIEACLNQHTGEQQ